MPQMHQPPSSIRTAIDGLEVHIRNVPAQSTERALFNFFLPYLVKLSIHNVDCRKQRDRNFASLTFLSSSDGERFLARHGQKKKIPYQRLAVKDLALEQLKFLGSPIYCEKSNREPNQFLLRTILKKKIDRQNFTSIVSHKPKPALPIEFTCRSLSCGVWSYQDSELIFLSQNSWIQDGIAKFGARSMILQLNTGLRVDFIYKSTRSITLDDEHLIFTMYEAPRFSQTISPGVLSDLLEQLQITNLFYRPQPPKRENGPQRHRIPCADDSHEATVGACLVYRVNLRQQITVGRPAIQESDKLRLLSKVSGVPDLYHMVIQTTTPPQSFSSQCAQLMLALSSLSCNIPFAVAFQLQKLVQDSYLLPDSVCELLPFVELMVMRSSTSVCVAAIRKLFSQIPFTGPDAEACNFEVDALVKLLIENEAQCKSQAAYESPEVSGNVALIHRAKVTPTGIRLCGPEAESNNRVLRKYAGYHDFFLRVQFGDEDGQPVRFNPRISNEKLFHERFKKVLENGINIAGRQFGFLGFSHSSLRAQSCWFMAPFVDQSILLLNSMLIEKLGDFTRIRSPAKCAARIGQAFSDTRIAVPIDISIVKHVNDVEVGSRVFSDGVGTMSQSIMDKLCEQLGKKASSRPTCFQIRYQGAKGMIALDTRLQGDMVVLRQSMIKFEGSKDADIEICESAYRPLPMYLNRQFIKILEDMGVEDKFFLNLQAQEVQRLRTITTSPVDASSFLKRQSIGDSVHLPWLINKLDMLGIDFQEDGFLRDVLELCVLTELRLLKHKTRIPVKNGWHLHGLMDETGLLEEGQIYCVAIEEGRRYVITGKDLIVSRAPALHPGDVQLVEGIMPPPGSPLLALSNCICFSAKGDRDLPSQLSGGDLDGDRYYIMWDQDAQPLRTFTPADYPRLPPIDIGRTVASADMTDFFIKFMESDQLGRIAVLHRVLADQKDDGTLNPDCITLAEMHSTAVDFSKTGIPVDMSKLPKYNPYRPDFEAPGPYVEILPREGLQFEAPRGVDDEGDQGDDDDDFTKYRYYESHKVLGKLYRAIDERKIFDEIKRRAEHPDVSRESTKINAAWEYVKKQCLLIQWEHKLDWAREIRDMYEDNLHNAMSSYAEHPSRPLSELEAFVGNILGKTGAQSKSQRELSTTLKEKVDTDSGFIVNCILKDDMEWSSEALERSMACLAVSLEEKIVFKRRERLVSFKYVAAAVCLREVERMYHA